MFCQSSTLRCVPSRLATSMRDVPESVQYSLSWIQSMASPPKGEKKVCLLCLSDATRLTCWYDEFLRVKKNDMFFLGFWKYTYLFFFQEPDEKKINSSLRFVQ